MFTVISYLQQLEDKKNREETRKNYRMIDGNTREVEDWKNQKTGISKYKPKKRKAAVVIRHMAQNKSRLFFQNHDSIKKNMNKGLIYFYRPKNLQNIHCLHAMIKSKNEKIIVDVFSDKKTRFHRNEFNTSLPKILEKEKSDFLNSHRVKNFLNSHRVKKENIKFKFKFFRIW